MHFIIDKFLKPWLFWRDAKANITSKFVLFDWMINEFSGGLLWEKYSQEEEEAFRVANLMDLVSQ